MMTADTLSTRAVAAKTLDRVVRDGAYSNVLVALPDYVARSDHGLYQRLVYEALRNLPAIDEAIDRDTTRDISRIQPEVISVMRIATAEIRHMDRAHHSAVSEAVDAVRELGRPSAARFVNGVLRSVARHAGQPVAADAFGGMPEWLYDRLATVFDENVDDFLAASNLPAEIGIRSRDGVERGQPTGVDGASYVLHDGSVGELAHGGLVDIIDPASVAVANALGVEEGDTVADLAAAPGGKTRVLADNVGADGMVVAVDRHRRRLLSARKRFRDVRQIDWIIGDALAPPLARASFDKVLLDAPCTGLGTLRRRPEVRYRIDPESPGRLGSIQRSMLEAALKLVRPDGRLVYSVCTVFPEESIDVVSGLDGNKPTDCPGIPWGDGILLAPHITGTDGMFITVFDR